MSANNFLKNPLKDPSLYEKVYQESISDNDSFWLRNASCVDWVKYPSVANESSFSPDVEIKWFEDGILNACYNCVDRHAENTPEKVAIIFEKDEPGTAEKITYKDLYKNVCKFASVLKSLGVKRGDIVTIYLPMIPEVVYAMLACARIGAAHSVVFAGFSANALGSRLSQANSKLLITTEQSLRGGKITSLKNNVDIAINADGVVLEKILLVGETGEKTQDKIEEFSYSKLSEIVSIDNRYEEMNAMDPLFVLYTSGSTGKPKGVVHGTGGYMVYASITHKLVFDLQDDDVYFCTADVGWITGHSYGVYGPLCNGSTIVLFQGTPTYPDASRFWNIIDDHKVSIFYTAPTALRSLVKFGDEFVEKASLKSLKVLGSVGEPIDPATWHWYYEKIGKKNCPIMDTWWQTESGGFLICPLYQSEYQKPSCAAKPFFGVQPVIMDDKEPILKPNEKGSLCIKMSWPGQTIGVLGDKEYFKQSYFSSYEGLYTSGDGAKFDNENDIWILGRMDDVLNVSGHRFNSAELEQAIASHDAIVEACVVGFPHDIKGQGIFVFAIPHNNISLQSDILVKELRNHIRTVIGPIATPDGILLVPDLPKTRSGKIIRRILRKIASDEFDNFGDTATLSNPECLVKIINSYKIMMENEKK